MLIVTLSCPASIAWSRAVRTCSAEAPKVGASSSAAASSTLSFAVIASYTPMPPPTIPARISRTASTRLVPLAITIPATIATRPATSVM